MVLNGFGSAYVLLVVRHAFTRDVRLAPSSQSASTCGDRSYPPERQCMTQDPLIRQLVPQLSSSDRGVNRRGDRPRPSGGPILASPERGSGLTRSRPGTITGNQPGGPGMADGRTVMINQYSRDASTRTSLFTNAGSIGSHAGKAIAGVVEVGRAKWNRTAW